ncbi:hypothetical protein POJ06DRAFT_296390 [Lipomyces tetrasporus]|uniref:Uncharacterized protein n=1 Tax=Lipomyces tetrasporus TaxID=54092 RepID=A0AAD7VRU8_9ASCO|nr:uncharacterized protein POJ06DRAFT_296390 [Lipomyces tetrasporus]KAJ8098500.1 hypothetical protein POJ06DRAFT_296390 [Lipomyces tetrasporus]
MNDLYFVLNDGIDEEASPEARLDSSQNATSLENDVLPSESASQIQQLQLESLAEIQVEENLPGVPDFRNLHPLTGHGHTLTYPNLKIPGSLRKVTKGS